MDGWLVNRLTPSKREEARWRELAEAMEDFWEWGFDPSLHRLEARRSIFSAHPDDLTTIIREMGDFVEFGLATGDSRPLAVAWRRAEVLRKDQEYIITETLARDFKGLDVSWAPLFASKAAAYGSAFYTEQQILHSGLDLGDFFMTSRGGAVVDSNVIHGAGLDKATFAVAVRRRIRSVKPLHIVYGGEYYSTAATMAFDPVGVIADGQSQSHAIALASAIVAAEGECTSTAVAYMRLAEPLPFNVILGSNVGIANGIGSQAIEGIEGDELPPDAWPTLGRWWRLDLTEADLHSPAGATGGTQSEEPFGPVFAFNWGKRSNRLTFIDLSVVDNGGTLGTPRVPRFDAVPADFAPLDITFAERASLVTDTGATVVTDTGATVVAINA